MAAGAFSSILGGSPLEPASSKSMLKRLALIALLAVALGLAMQGLILVVKLASGGAFPGSRLFLDLAQGVTWSAVVCAGVGIGTVMTKARALLMGVLGMIFAPLALGLAKGAQQVVATALNNVAQPSVLSLAAISAVKAVEYGVLGWLLGKLVEKQNSHLSRYVLTGAVIGALFGGTTTFLTYEAALQKGAPLATSQILGTATSELVFPIGCALVIFLGQLVRLALPGEGGSH